MNARLAAQESEVMINELIETSKRASKRKGISLKEAINFGVDIRIKHASTESRKHFWEKSRNKALELAN